VEGAKKVAKKKVRGSDCREDTFSFGGGKSEKNVDAAGNDP